MARKGILSSDISKKERPRATAAKMMPRGAVGALQSSLTKLQENAVQEIEADLIDDAGVEDRLGIDPEAQNGLKQSLEAYGQQVPVLLRPHPSTQGRYEIVYGRRRLKALKELGRPVKAMIRQLDDHALVMAQGQENTSRQDLSFIEKASFAAQLQESGYERQTIADALSIDLPMVSRLLKIGTAFPLPFLRKIGSAPGIGRDRWMKLAQAIESPGAMGRATALTDTAEYALMNSDTRFEAILERALHKPAKAAAKPLKPRTIRGKDGTALAEVRATGKAIAVNIPTKTAPEFGAWINHNAETLIQELHDRWKKDGSED